ncbi:hypothetical protein GR160_07985 [Flavobacterium sp. Sd200]|uniref:hypothetical protein n=1 Tax=Flavobacterium sp. Sd200 TaxID=2692211 RepID=UPI00136A25A9|nr:hypothetical protein [Flavobacterium sp. Sd200]MXN91168.1 hypothetical protein [Flavobacterium sp. Sd200]
MGLFTKAKNKPASPLKQMATARISSVYNRIKNMWARWVETRTAAFTKKNWLTAIACLIILMGGYSGYLIMSAFTSEPTAFLKVGSIRRPAHTGNTGDTKIQEFISEGEYKNIERFHRYMDSIARDPMGRKEYDSITKARPGLMDSISQFERYYQQFKEK